MREKTDEIFSRFEEIHSHNEDIQNSDLTSLFKLRTKIASSLSIKKAVVELAPPRKDLFSLMHM
jgi:hypothetical protein